MTNNLVQGFFYGLYMDPDLLKIVGVNPIDPRVARIDGYRLDLRGSAKIAPDDGKSVWGMAVHLSPADLHRMYSGETTRSYRPTRMVAATRGGERIEVTCYNLPVDTTALLNVDYLEKLRVIARKLGLPADYVDELDCMAA